MAEKRIVVATHGHCFDGLASAALFTHLAGALYGASRLSFHYRSCGYGPEMGAVPERWLDGDENAILDFRHTQSARLSWYFDHHVTAFPSDEARDEALATAVDTLAAPEEGAPSPRDPAAQRVYYDPAYGSCTKLVADVARRRFGVEAQGLAELVAWADVIDAARFGSAAAANDDREPALRLAAVIEHHGDGPFLTAMVPRLLERGVRELAVAADVEALWAPIARSRGAFAERLARRAERVGRVAVFDLTDATHEVAAKFYAYALFPDCVYSVTLLRTKQHVKVSVGYNPWCGVSRDRDIASICRRYGGGGHPVVGAASFPLAEVGRAREAARTIASELDA
jgi:hypothetical protein